MPRLTSSVPSPLAGEGQDGGCATGAAAAILGAALLALLATPAGGGDSFLDRSAPVQDAVPYGMALEPATPAATAAAAATPAADD